MNTALEPITHEGVEYQPVLVAQSRPFARALIYEWELHDGKPHRYLLAGKAFNVPVAVFSVIAPKARARVEREGQAAA